MKFATKPMQQCPLHLKYVVTLSRETRSPKLLLSQEVLLFKLNLNVPIVH